MFNATEFRQIRNICPEDLAHLLHQLGIDVPNWDDEDEFKIYAKLDDKITNNLSRLMKSDSVIGGYIKLLTLGGIDFSYSETDNALLNKVVNNQNMILRGTPHLHSASKEKSSKTKVAAAPTKNVRRIEQKQISVVPMVVGGVVAVVGVGILAMGRPLLGIVAAVIGGAGVTVGLKGKTVVREVVTEAHQSVPKVASPTNTNTKAVFSESEIKQVLSVLTQVNKIVRAI